MKQNKFFRRGKREKWAVFFNNHLRFTHTSYEKCVAWATKLYGNDHNEVSIRKIPC